VPLTGDASDRRYFRVLPRDAASQVLAVHPGPMAFDTLPFVNVARLLTAMPVPVPRILAHSDALGIIALEDLGDVTLQAHVGTASPEEHAALYRQAVTLVNTIQRRGRELASADYVPYGIAFDVEKLAWELQFFTKHFLEAYRGAELTDSVRTALAREYASIADDLASGAPVLCHRDYHSRNLMVQDGRLRVLDFQDARLGCRAYDLSSLLRDSYVTLPEEVFEGLFASYLARWAEASGRPEDPEAFRVLFDHMALQRNLKAVGTFASQWRLYGRDYRRYIAPTLAYVRANLAKYDDLARLRSLLSEYLEEVA